MSNASYNNFVNLSTGFAFRKNAVAVKSGKIQPAFRKFLKDKTNNGIYQGVDLLKPLGRALNPKTGRIVNRSRVYTKKGTLRAQFKPKPQKLTPEYSRTFTPNNYVYGVYDGANMNHYGWWYKILKASGLTGNIRIIVKYYGQSTEEIEELKSQFNGGANYVVDTLADIPQNFTKTEYNKSNIFKKFIVSSAYPNIVAYLLSLGFRAKIIITKMTELTPSQISQSFADGSTHCLIEPIRYWAGSALAKATSKAGRDKYTSIVNKIIGKELKKGKRIGYIEKYAGGIPEEELGALCDDLQIAISIEKPFGDKKYLEYKSIKKPLKHFKYLNTRINHVEELTTQSHEDNEGDDYTTEELEELAHELHEEGKHFTFSRNAYGISNIQTLDSTYSITDDYRKAVHGFNEFNHIKGYEIDALKFPELVEFLSLGTHFNGTTDFKELPSIDAPNLRHIDIKKAYTQYKKSKYYSGFVGKITDFRKVDNYEQKGFYYIEKLDMSNADERFAYFNNKMNWFKNYNIYTDTELTFLKDMGCTFSVRFGAYGVKADISFTDELIKGKQVIKRVGKDDVKISYYAKCVGQWASLNYEKGFNMFGEREYFQTLTDDTVNVQYDEYRKEAHISYDKKSVMTLKHLAGQITAYQRLLLMEQLFAMDYKKIIRVCVDGIYYDDHEYERHEVFADKTHEMTFSNSPTESYLSSVYDKEIKRMTEDKPDTIRGAHFMANFRIGKERAHYENEVWLGQGGTGKTYTNVGDCGLIKCLYVAPSWKLARAMQEEMKNDAGANKTIDVNVKHRVLYMEYSDKLQEKYNTFLFDEVSQYTEREKNMIMKIEGKKIFMGDIGYQLEAVVDYQALGKIYEKKGCGIDFYKWCKQEGYTETNHKGFDNYITLKTDWRAKDCEKLQDVKKRLRTYIQDGKYQTNEKRLALRAEAIEYLHKVLPTITRDELRKTYKAHDMILCSTHEIKNEYNEMFKDVEKYLIKNNTKLFSNSEITYEKPPAGVKAEITHGFTIHAIQGETLGHNDRLYIDVRNMFSDRMIYTAVSRARRCEQVFLIQ